MRRVTKRVAYQRPTKVKEPLDLLPVKPARGAPRISGTSIPVGFIRCPACGKRQPDKGKQATCEGCGIQPTASRAYPVGHPLHPVD